MQGSSPLLSPQHIRNIILLTTTQIRIKLWQTSLLLMI
nr:MAG TPA: hypothetical protein [Caudoviricetes sp.]